MKLSLSPRQGAGPIRFGLPRGEVRAVVQSPSEPFEKAEGSPLSDAFFDGRLKVHYDASDKACCVEIASGGPVDAVYEGMRLLASPAPVVVAHMAKRASWDKQDPELPACYVFPALDLALRRDDARHPTFTSVILGVEGYFER